MKWSWSPAAPVTAKGETAPPPRLFEVNHAHALGVGAAGACPVCAWCRADLTNVYPIHATAAGWFQCDAHPEYRLAEALAQAGRYATWRASVLPFSLHRPCPKCGNEHRTAVLHDSHFGETLWSGERIVVPDCWPLEWEHLMRHCGVCGYESIEAPLDTIPDEDHPGDLGLADDSGGQADG